MRQDRGGISIVLIGARQMNSGSVDQPSRQITRAAARLEREAPGDAVPSTRQLRGQHADGRIAGRQNERSRWIDARVIVEKRPHHRFHRGEQALVARIRLDKKQPVSPPQHANNGTSPWPRPGPAFPRAGWCSPAQPKTGIRQNSREPPPPPTQPPWTGSVVGSRPH